MKRLLQARNHPKEILMLVMFFMSSILLSCNNDALTEDQINEIDFSLVLMDENGTEGIVFEKGTDITFALKLINSTEREIKWYNDGCELLASDEFLLVYLKSNETDDEFVPIGRPYHWPVYCLTINLDPQPIPQGHSIPVKIPWSNNLENECLGIGKYYVKANFSITIDGNSRSWNLRTAFELK